MLKNLFMGISSVNNIHLFRPNHNHAGADAKNATINPLTGIEPAALRFRYSALTNCYRVQLYNSVTNFSRNRYREIITIACKLFNQILN